jgi:hypothetical protein
MMEKILDYIIFIVLGVLIIYPFYLRWGQKHWLIIVKKSKRFDPERRNKVSPDKLREYINSLPANAKYLQVRHACFELYEDEKIIFLNHPWGESYCQCNVDEYKELASFICTRYKQSVSPAKVTNA